MDEVLRLPGRGSTFFYFTDPGSGGMDGRQQEYICRLIERYRRKYPVLEINAVWDFGREEGDPAGGGKYGSFADSRDNAVYNAQMLTISYNHVRAARMRCEADAEQVKGILEEMRIVQKMSEEAALLEPKLLSEGVPYPEIPTRIREILLSGYGPGAESGRDPEIWAAARQMTARLLEPGRENLLPLTDPLFAQVRAIRALEDTESIERLTAHEIGHLLSEETGAVKDREVLKLFRSCRDGFENIYEFCAECFMAGELTAAFSCGIGLADRYHAAQERILRSFGRKRTDA